MEKFEPTPDIEGRDGWIVRKEMGDIMHKLELLTGRNLRPSTLGLGEHQTNEWIELANRTLDDKELWDSVLIAKHGSYKDFSGIDREWIIDGSSKEDLKNRLRKLVEEHG